jgi:lipoprotein-anchoring transpeptidase ErfK/SrfK
MTDIYVGSRQPRWGLAVIFILLLGATAIWWVNRSPNQEPPPPQKPDLEEADLEEAVPEVEPVRPLPTPTTRTEPLPTLEDITALLEAENLHQARTLAFERLGGLPEGPARLTTEALLGDLHIRMVFHKIPMQEKVTHVVARGDTLGKLAQQYGTTEELIALSNGIERNLIRLGETLRILNAPFDAVVDKTRNDMVVTLGGRFFKRYAVGTGTHSSTPEGDYLITLRLKHPVWYRPDGEEFPYGHPENLLGTHYLKLNTPGIGLHGTWEPDTIGSQSSAGCVRLKNEMIEELYNLLPEGTSVRIENGS